MVKRGGRSSRDRPENVIKKSPRTRQSAVPAEFRSLLAEVIHDDSATEAERPLKKRKLGRATGDYLEKEVPNTRPEAIEQVRKSRSPSTASAGSDRRPIESALRQVQTIIDYSEESGDSEESDVDWEDVALDQEETSEQKKGSKEEQGDISIIVGRQKSPAKAANSAKRKVLTSAERRVRLDVHKMHLLCLIYHAFIRNSWCNDREIQNNLKLNLTTQTVKNLHPDPELSQAQATKGFADALHHVKTLWKDKFDVSARGLSRPFWEANVNLLKNFSLSEDIDNPIDRSDFRKAATSLKGSQDIGAQLLCCLFRSVGVETRLICSLQCLPFTGVMEPTTPQKPRSNKKVVHADGNEISSEDGPSTPTKQGQSLKKPQAANTTPSIIKRITGMPMGRSQRSRPADLGKAPKMLIAQKRSKHRQQYPVFWVEVFNTTSQKWIPIDPLATFTIDKPSSFEPPLNYSQNGLYYVVAFDSDGYAKDVTPRYSKFFNSKTRQGRVEVTEGGEIWWKKALKLFHRRAPLDRDQMEDAALARKVAAEPMPRNVQDFKKHPIYVLERHIKHNEVLHPRQEVGKVSIGPSSSGNVEPVFRRRDVHTVRSADKWYRLGREVKQGAQPLKRSNPRRRRALSLNEQGLDDEDSSEVPLYAIFQTDLYVPPPAVRGRVPRNAYGNLDIFVPSMVPKGAIHIRSADAATAARMIRVDYADAVTGFQFKGRHGTAIVEGVVVAEEYATAIRETIRDIARTRDDEAQDARSREALRLWRKFFVGLRIVERVNEYATEGETADVQEKIVEEIQNDSIDDDEGTGGGGFFPDADVEVAQPTARNFAVTDEYSEDLGGGFLPEDNSEDDESYREDGTKSIDENGSSPEEADYVDDSTLEDLATPPSKGGPTDIFGSDLLSKQSGLSQFPTSAKRYESIRISYNFEKDSPSYSDRATPRTEHLEKSSPAAQSSDKEDRNKISEPVLQGETDAIGSHASGVERMDIDIETSGVNKKYLSSNLGQSLDMKESLDEKGSDEAQKTHAKDKSESNSDTNSLLSHDPEDEDAEPDWLQADDDDDL